MRTARTGAAIAAVALVLFASALPLRAQGTTDVKQQARELATLDIATQLGLKAAPGQPTELSVGASATFALVDPAKMNAVGVTGVHAGARVTIIRIGADKLRVEIDEVDPVVITKKATLKVGEDGKLTAITP